MLLMRESNKNHVQMLGYRDDTDQVQCMVSNVVGLNFQEVVEDENHNVKIYGPYETDQQAMEHARKTLSVTT